MHKISSQHFLLMPNLLTALNQHTIQLIIDTHYHQYSTTINSIGIYNQPPISTMSIKLIPQPHEAHNLQKISIWTNSQKLRKPNPIVSARSNTYWDLRGRYQNEYDERLDLLPDEGIADTVSV